MVLTQGGRLHKIVELSDLVVLVSVEMPLVGLDTGN